MTRTPATPPPGDATSARLYNAYRGGEDAKDAYPQDVEIAEQLAGLGLDVALIAQQNRAFHERAVQYVAADLGIGQILDIGCGYPSTSDSNTHEITQREIPAARVAYVDHDPTVLAHAEALLTSSAEGVLGFIHQDLRNPQKILDDARRVLDFDQPVALLLIAVVHFLTDADAPYTAVRTLVDALPPGSAVVLSHVTDDFAPDMMRNAERLLKTEGRVQSQTRSREAIARFVTGLELVEPGLVPVHQWRPDDLESSQTPAGQIHNYGCIARI
ncbi:SAM-dependent methyltransferase [Streptomyces sp. NPDC004726]